jgi:hypothetical protein
MFGELRSYDTNDDYIINGVESACDCHNVKRIDGARASTTFIDTDWIVAFDSDGSTLGIHEDDKTNNTKTKDVDLEELFNEFVKTYYADETPFTGEKVELIKEYKGYQFEYEFLYSDDVITEDGTILWDNVNNLYYGYYYITISITMKDKDGKELYKTNDDNPNSYGYISLAPSEE